MNDYGMRFENVIKRYIGNPTTQIYYANYYGDNFMTRALLFAVCIKEMNVNKEQYSRDDIEILQEFEHKLSKEGSPHNDSIECIDFFSARD